MITTEGTLQSLLIKVLNLAIEAMNHTFPKPIGNWRMCCHVRSNYWHLSQERSTHCIQTVGCLLASSFMHTKEEMFDGRPQLALVGNPAASIQNGHYKLQKDDDTMLTNILP